MYKTKHSLSYVHARVRHKKRFFFLEIKWWVARWEPSIQAAARFLSRINRFAHLLNRKSLTFFLKKRGSLYIHVVFHLVTMTKNPLDIDFFLVLLITRVRVSLRLFASSRWSVSRLKRREGRYRSGDHFSFFFIRGVRCARLPSQPLKRKIEKKIVPNVKFCFTFWIFDL